MTSLSLDQHPALNCTAEGEGEDLRLWRHSNHNISVAMDSPQGLMVPVVQRVQTKSVLQISDELMALKARGSFCVYLAYTDFIIWKYR